MLTVDSLELSHLFRMLIVLLPSLFIAYAFVHESHPVKHWVGALFAHIWQFQWRLILFSSGVSLGVWEFSIDGMLLQGVPTDIILGSSLLLAVVPQVLPRTPPIIVLVLLDILIYLLFYPITAGLSQLAWLIPIALIVIVPSQLLARWTAHDKQIYGRSILQNIAWSILLLWLLPSIIFNLSDDSWQPLLQREVIWNLLFLSTLIIPAIFIISALYIFAKEGDGTGFPYDAPKHLVTTGIYRYLSNPMQTGIVSMMLLWGAILQSSLVAFTGVVALLLFFVFKDVCNGNCKVAIDNPDWRKYQASVPKWLPRRL